MTCNDLDAVACGSALVIATEWNHFRNLDLPRLKLLGTVLLVRPSKCLSPLAGEGEAGFE